VRQAAQQLAAQGLGVDVVSVTSWSELAREGAAAGAAEPYIARLLGQTRGPIVAVSDYVRAVPDSVRAYLPAGRRCATLGTDGFGRSDTRAALRRFFEVDAASIVERAQALHAATH
jgi:pyruvate dehydrogenase E1 component